MLVSAVFSNDALNTFVPQIYYCMRGQKLFKELKKTNVISTPLRKGRNECLMQKRNECLIARYYYFSRFSKMSYEDVLNSLANEFYLTPERIARIVLENTDKLAELRKNETTVSFFKKKFGHLKW